MAPLFVLFASVVLAATAVEHVAGQPGFLSIDCGLEATSNKNGYKHNDTGIVYVSDGPYVDGGESHTVGSEIYSLAGGVMDPMLTVRSFPSGDRNCYALPTDTGAKYLVRMLFFYGNYDGKHSPPQQFDVHLGVNHWDTYEAGVISMSETCTWG